MKVRPAITFDFPELRPRASCSQPQDAFTLTPSATLRGLEQAPARPHRAWKAELPAGRQTTCAVGQDGTVYTMGSDNTLRAFEPLSGKSLWTLERPGQPRQESYLEAGPKRLYAAGTEGTVVALDAADGRPLWATELVGPLESPPSQAPDGTLLVAGRGGLLYALDPMEGQRNWVARVSGSGYLTSRPVTDGKVVYAGTAEGRLLALDFESGQKRWEAVPGGVVRPALAPNGVTIGTTGRVLGYADDRQIWEFRGGETDEFQAPVSAGPVTVAACRTYAVGLVEGREVWRESMELAPVAPQLDGRGRVILCAPDGGISVLDPATGRAAWRASAEASPTGSAIPGPGDTVLHTSATGLTAMVESDAAWARSRSETPPRRAALIEGEHSIQVGAVRLKRRVR